MIKKLVILIASLIVVSSCQKTSQTNNVSPGKQIKTESTILSASSGAMNNSETKDIRNSPLGGPHDITLFIDPEPQKIIGDSLTKILYRTLFPAHEEDVFKVRLFPAEKFAVSNVWQNVVLVSQLDQPAEIAAITKNHLTEEQRKEVQIIGIGLFQMESVWARSQHVFFLVARDQTALIQFGQVYAQKIVAILEGILNQQVAAEIYSNGLNPDIMKFLTENYPWQIDIPRFYKIYQHNHKDGLLMFRLRDTDPLLDRIITIHWEPAGNRKLNLKTVRQMRDKLMATYSNQDKVHDAFLEAKEAEFAGHRAIQVDGNWYNDKDTIGGPFKTYAFINNNNFYLVDYFILAIGIKKEAPMRQLDIIANTFRIQK